MSEKPIIKYETLPKFSFPAIKLGGINRAYTPLFK